MGKHVVSTLTSDVRFADWVDMNGIKKVQKSVLVKGGAGVARGPIGHAVTNAGVITHVSDEDARFLSEHPHFKRQQEAGYVKIVNIARDPDSVAQSMSVDNGSRPRNDGDIRKTKKDSEDSLQVVTNKK